MSKSARSVLSFLILLFATLACSRESTQPEVPAEPPPSILLVTMDTTRADRLGVESELVDTPELSALARRGLRFAHAYSTAPTTLPAHTSMLTGLYPKDHGIRENGRRVGERLPVVAELLKSQRYTSAAFVSGFPLAGQFGLARGFDHYDDDLGNEGVERDARATTERALAYLEADPPEPLFVWVHYFDPHEPYEPPEPFGSRYPADPYLGEIAFMDHELGRLVAGFVERSSARPWKVLVVGDHGEGLGDHGEMLHGNLLYQGVMRVPLIVLGTGIPSGEVDRAVSVRQVFDTILDWAGLDAQSSLLAAADEPVLAEAMKPFLQYGWQPQFMAVADGVKVIRSGDTEIYDLEADPAETENLVGRVELDPRLREAIRSYAVLALSEQAPANDDLSPETREKLASLGYVGSDVGAPRRDDAPNPKDMAHLFRDLDIGAAMFIRKDYEQAIPLFGRVLEADPGNLAVCLRLAVAHSVLGNEERAEAFFERAQQIDPSSVDLRHYQAMHYLRYGQWELAEPLLESVLAQMPERLPALEGMAQIRTRQGRIDEAIALQERIVQSKSSPALELARLGELRMAVGDTPGAIRAFEGARDLMVESFTYNLELGVCYLADRRLPEAAASLDRVSPSHPAYPMALFKRAQVSVLLAEPGREERIRAAWKQADDTTRPLIENEALFRDYSYR